ncbi:hypothetical protein VNO77_14712 [Canavalia gladiata]|uniref:Aminotransferase-like plant mobile domain-containing protein n=1 Tax=Canavalia gladiata TaxID=3824 RepID=A0AAN9QR32_CANGL
MIETTFQWFRLRLLTSYVEQGSWRPETHTFHTLPGECTITLQDVVILTGFPIDGQPVIGCTSSRAWEGILFQLLGASPAEREIIGGSLKMSWLLQHFASIEDHMGNEEQLDRFTRAYMLWLIGGVFFMITQVLEFLFDIFP